MIYFSNPVLSSASIAVITHTYVAPNSPYCGQSVLLRKPYTPVLLNCPSFWCNVYISTQMYYLTTKPLHTISIIVPVILNRHYNENCGGGWRRMGGA